MTTVRSIETPALLVDLDALEWNIRTMAEFFAGRQARLRPHFKTHKSPDICRLQLAAGAKGITCAKLGETEAVLAAGVTDVLIANQVVDPAKITRLASLARGAKITVCVDRPGNVRDLSHAAVRSGSTLGVLVEVDVGMNRCGARSAEEALALAECVARSPGLAFEGIQAYEGHLVQLADAGERRAGVRRMEETIGGIKAMLERRGLRVKEVSGGGTATYAITGDGTIWTEIQAGSYVFMDASYQGMGLPFRQALSVLATIIHTHAGRAVSDAGLKVCSSDHGPPVVKGQPALEIRLNEEHGIIDDPEGVLRYGQRIEYVPSHCCTTVNLHDRYHGIRGGALEAVWPITGRGRSQ